MGNTRREVPDDGRHSHSHSQSQSQSQSRGRGRAPHGDDARCHSVQNDETSGAEESATMTERGRVIDRVATPDEHAYLAATVGWQGHFDDHLRAASLAASIAGVVYTLADGTVVGMARAVGDGLQYAYIQDVIVRPDHGDHGIATRLVERLLELLRPDPPAELFVGLFASDDARGVYESLGFTTAEATGMYQRMSGEEERRHLC